MQTGKKFIILGALIFFVIGIFLQNNKANRKNILGDNKTDNSQKLIENITTIAGCPTFHYMLDKLEDNNDIKAIRTEATAESIDLLIQKKVDLIISGRALKETEPYFLSEKIGPGYDFIFNKEIFLSEEGMQLIPFYTNLSLDKIINDFVFVSENNLTKIDDIFKFLDKGIIITSLEGKMPGEVVHIFQENGERVGLSRSPRLYYFPELEEEKLEIIKKIIKEN